MPPRRIARKWWAWSGAALKWRTGSGGKHAYKGRLGEDRCPRHSDHFIAYYAAPPTAGIMRASGGTP
jgi:hypothetical protein